MMAALLAVAQAFFGAVEREFPIRVGVMVAVYGPLGGLGMISRSIEIDHPYVTVADVLRMAGACFSQLYLKVI